MIDSGENLRESANGGAEDETYLLRLFVIGASPNSIRAVSNVKALCEKHLKNRYTLEIVDVYQQPEIAEKEEIIALPLLVREKPSPTKRLIGDMSNEAKVLKGLGIQ
ncbi:MAG: circadian clock protein KaiB [Sphingobacteriaceae bacterium]|jgi:circadian clock protein KaiB|nr:circadian clock protein KaiB [Sphingobacteriaceae bacterium]